MAHDASAIGLATVDINSGRTLDTWYPEPALGGHTKTIEGLAPAADDLIRGVQQTLVATTIDLEAPPADVPDTYLRLHLLSHRMVAPHGVNL